MPAQDPDSFASRSSWKNVPLPEKRAALNFSASYSSEEFKKIRRGLVPQQMEDKWFVFFEDHWLSIHRSWTGHCIYAIRFEENAGSQKSAESWVNRQAEQYKATDAEYDRAMLAFIIDRLLLKKDVPFPMPAGIEASKDALLYRHHIIGLRETGAVESAD